MYIEFKIEQTTPCEILTILSTIMLYLKIHLLYICWVNFNPLIKLILLEEISIKLAKRRFLGKFESHNTIYTFKNYFTTVFLVINFQFSTNKRYPNRPKVCSDYLIWLYDVELDVN